ncbi:hypothetical protein LJB92_03070 [Bacteroidales bacterium OttesenSCG-928-M06]|nr:hypothetical protein [Bacteroidales bacterium OttesenSCG-928-M06]
MKPRNIILFIVIVCYSGIAFAHSDCDHDWEVSSGENIYSSNHFGLQNSQIGVFNLSANDLFVAENSSSQISSAMTRSVNPNCPICGGTGLDPDALPEENTPCPVCGAGVSTSTPIGDGIIVLLICSLFFLLRKGVVIKQYYQRK